MGIFYDSSDDTYIVHAVGEAIKTTVTASGDVVCDWLDDVHRIYRRHLHHLVVGLDVEWCPPGLHGTSRYYENPVALLQLCVGRRCLVFQLLHSDYVPDDLSEFLMDDRFQFVGAGICGDVDKLYRDYGLEVEWNQDLRELAAVQMGRREIRQWGLQNLAREIMGVNMEKSRRVSISNWGVYALSMEQIEYAAADAFVSFEVGRRLNVGDY